MSVNEKEQRRGGFGLVLAVAIGRPIAECAALGGVSESTVRRRMRSPRFMARVHQLQQQMTQLAAGKVVASLDEAVETFRALLASDNHSVRLGAAHRITDLALKMGEMAELRLKVNQLEQMLQELTNGTGEPGEQVARQDTSFSGDEAACGSDEPAQGQDVGRDC